MLEHVCAGVCWDADVRSYHLEQGTRNHSEVITVIFLSRGTRFANGEDGVDKKRGLRVFCNPTAASHSRKPRGDNWVIK